MPKKQYLKILDACNAYILVNIAEVNLTLPEIIKRAYEDKFMELVGHEDALYNSARYLCENGMLVFDRIPGTSAAGFTKLYKLTPRGKIALENAINAYCTIIEKMNSILEKVKT
jgi:DNA-binding PadR family transcriptional regulator